MSGRLDRKDKEVKDAVMLQVEGSEIVAAGQPVRLRGVSIGGWLMMENFITGFPGVEYQQREVLSQAMGQDLADHLFERFLEVFFADADAAYLAELGMNCLRIPINYRHLESDLDPRKLRAGAFRHIDRALELCRRHGMYAVLDLHALPGSQNGDWHSDNAGHHALFWRHRDFQDRAVWLWQQIAQRYRDDPVIAAYNPLNEPADPTGLMLRPFCDRLTDAIRAEGDEHIIFLDGDRYSQDFSIFEDVLPNTVYVVHQYPAPGWYEGEPYPGPTGGIVWDSDRVEAEFLELSAFMRDCQLPLWVGEFGPIYRGEQLQDRGRAQLLRDQLDTYERHNAGWSLWTYKDIGIQGMVSAAPDSPWITRLAPLLEQKRSLGADRWGVGSGRMAPVIADIENMFRQESPSYEPWPFGLRWLLVRTVRNITVSEMLLPRFGELFEGVDEEEIERLVGSFAFEACTTRPEVDSTLRRVLTPQAHV